MYFKLNDFEFNGKRVLVRVDYNVPVDEFGNVADNKRIIQSIPTLNYLLNHNAKIIIMTHMGRPDGKPNEKYKLDKIALELQGLIGLNVKKLNDCVGEEVKKEIDAMQNKEILMLENVRFYAEEEKNDEGFAAKLAQLGELYVNDAFGTCHRAHASVHAITKLLPAAAGYLLEKEIDIIGSAIDNPKKPFVAIMGGAKVSDKIGVINNLSKKADNILIGGAMANTFLKAIGKELGKSKYEKDKLDAAKELYEKNKDKIILPIDLVCAKELNGSETRFVDIKNDAVSSELMALDVGPKTISKFESVLSGAKTIIWNGPLGYFENEIYNTATKKIGEFIADESSQHGAISIIGGGDSAAAIEKYEFSKRLTHISTGGGASLEYIEGKKLPAIAALEENYLKFKK